MTWPCGRPGASSARPRCYGISLGLGLLSAAWFSEPATRAQVLAIVPLLASFAAGRAACSAAPP